MASKNTRFLQFSKPFIDATKNVFETMVFTKIEPEKPEIKKDNVSRGDVSAVLGISGEVDGPNGVQEFKGMLVIAWPEETYLKTAGAMLMDTFNEMNDEIADVGAEICNMIMGNAKRDLKGIGYTTNMAIPSTVTGKDHTLKYPPGTYVIIIPCNSTHGKFFLELCYHD